MFYIRLKNLLNIVSSAAALVGGLGLLAVGLLLAGEVLLRFFGRPTQWIAQWSMHIFAFAMLCGAAHALRRGRHVRVELLLMRLPERSRLCLDALTSLAGAAVCALITLHGAEHLLDVVMTGETTATVLRIPLWLTDFPIFLGFFLLTMQFLLLAAEKILHSADSLKKVT